MRLTSFVVVIVAVLLFLIPMMNQEQSAFEREAQEESPMERVLGEENTYKITYEVERPEDESIADILWMKLAAEMALEQKIPYFNVLDQEIYTVRDEETGEEQMIVEGVIQLDTDPMRAEYDAHEIESLVLPERP